MLAFDRVSISFVASCVSSGMNITIQIEWITQLQTYISKGSRIEVSVASIGRNHTHSEKEAVGQVRASPSSLTLSTLARPELLCSLIVKKQVTRLPPLICDKEYFPSV